MFWFVAAGQYFLAKALNDTKDDPDKDDYEKDVKRELKAIPHRELNLRYKTIDMYCNLWDRRCARFYGTYPGGDREAVGETLRDFMLFLSKLCSHSTWHATEETSFPGFTYNGDLRRTVGRLRTRVENTRPGPIDRHTYLPPDWLAHTFDTIFRKHTQPGNDDPDTPHWMKYRNKTQHFLTRLLHEYEDNGQTHPDNPSNNVRLQELFYKLLKDAVIATLQYGETVIENYEIGATKHVSIIANYGRVVGEVDGWGTFLYRVLFKLKNNQNWDNPLGNTDYEAH